jgi:integrase
MGRRDFGSVRRLPSGRWQARYPDGTGLYRSMSFATRGDASRYLARTRTDMDRGDWFDPDAGHEALESYAARWLATRRVKGRPLAPRTRERYASLLPVHILPRLGQLPLSRLEAAVIRQWHASLSEAATPGPATVAKAYRLLHAILNTAVVEQKLPRNPCMIPGASAETSAERPIATIDQVYDLADAVGDRWRCLVLLATFCGLRFGELAGLTRGDIDLGRAIVVVSKDLDELDGGRLQPGDVKSSASRRIVSIPEVLLEEVHHHLDTFAATGPKGAVFVGPAGGRLRRTNFRKYSWIPATRMVGVEGLRFHDLRHTGNTLAASTGASTRELMARMGHASARAALIYQHATRERDAVIASALSDLIGTRAQPGWRQTSRRRSAETPWKTRIVRDGRGVRRALARSTRR